MCRIAGIISFSQPQLCQQIGPMCQSMIHGGPDDDGLYTDADQPVALGVRRLALLDLSPAGHQPFLSQNGQVVLAFNGELYNYASLKATLKGLGYLFLSGTDTEVVLAAYLQWGTACFARFNGMFGLAIWDKRSQQLILARDHAGMKPLYYYVNSASQQLFFASEVRAFKQIDAGWPEDDAWRIRLLAYGHLPEPHTTLAGVKTLAAGHFMVVQLPSFKVLTQKWHQFQPKTILTSVAEATAALRNTLTQAVERHLVADAPLGAFLSGGVDSSLLTVLASRLLPPGRLHTVSLVFDEAGFSEQAYQQLVVEKTGAQHSTFLIKQQEFADSLPDILAAMDQPSNDGINAYFISKYARQSGLTAVLSGVGADELFGGYDTFSWRKRAQRLRKLPNGLLGLAGFASDDRVKRVAFLKDKNPASEYLFYRGFFIPSQIARLLNIDRRQVEQVIYDQNEQIAFSNEKHNSLHVSNLEQTFYLRNQLLRDADAMSMWHSLEIRMPFLDREVLNLCHSIAPEIRFPEGGKKRFLIDTFKDILPEAIWKRKKMGFTLPFFLWTRKATVYGAADHRIADLQGQLKSGNLKWSRYWTYLLSTGQPIGFLPPTKKILFLGLTTFSSTGGIEKFNRCFSMALHQLAVKNKWQVAHGSVYDLVTDPAYFPQSGFMGFKQRKLAFAWHLLLHSHHFDLVVVGHRNMGLPAFIAASLSKKPYWLLAHGIEVWQPLDWLRRRLFLKAKRVLCVSNFTANKVQQLYGVLPTQVSIFPNTIDPYFDSERQVGIADFHQKLALAGGIPVLLTVARLSASEKYKGYDDVLRALPEVQAKLGRVEYILAGKADPSELARLGELAASLGLEGTLHLPGFVPDAALSSLYHLANLFIMPSRKEGFGIVFIEAASCGLPLIAGNQDGSVDALLQGRLGTLVSPGNVSEIATAIVSSLGTPRSDADKSASKALVEQHFGFEIFKQRLEDLVSSAV